MNHEKILLDVSLRVVLADFTVTFEAGKGDPATTIIAKSGQILTKPNPDPVNERPTFVGWYDETGVDLSQTDS